MLHAATKKIVRHKRLVRREIEEREIEEREHHEVQVHRTYIIIEKNQGWDGNAK